MRSLVQDVRYAARQLRHSPGFTVTALLTLAIGIGANTAIFTLVHGVLLQSLPVKDPGQLYKLGDEYNCCVEGDLQGNWSMFSTRSTSRPAIARPRSNRSPPRRPTARG